MTKYICDECGDLRTCTLIGEGESSVLSHARQCPYSHGDGDEEPAPWRRIPDPTPRTETASDDGPEVAEYHPMNWGESYYRSGHCPGCKDKDAEIAQIKRNARIAFENVKGEYVDGWVTWADDGTVKLYNNMDDKIERLRKERNDARAKVSGLKEKIRIQEHSREGDEKGAAQIRKDLCAEIDRRQVAVEWFEREVDRLNEIINDQSEESKLDEILARLPEHELAKQSKT